MVDATRVYRKAEGFVVRPVGREFVVVPVRSDVAELESVFTLNAVAERIWRLVDGTRRAGDIVDAIVAEFDVTEEAAASDVGEFLAMLEEARLVS